MAPAVKARAVDGIWIRQAPGHSDRLGRSETPPAGRWQRADVTRALYLADSPGTATAEWYRSLAERGFYPEDYLPFDHHRWRVGLELANLSSRDRLDQVGLTPPTPDRRSWPAFQIVGEQLFADGWPGLLARAQPARAHWSCASPRLRRGHRPDARRLTRSSMIGSPLPRKE